MCQSLALKWMWQKYIKASFEVMELSCGKFLTSLDSMEKFHIVTKRLCTICSLDVALNILSLNNIFHGMRHQNLVSWLNALSAASQRLGSLETYTFQHDTYCSNCYREYQKHSSSHLRSISISTNHYLRSTQNWRVQEDSYESLYMKKISSLAPAHLRRQRQISLQQRSGGIIMTAQNAFFMNAMHQSLLTNVYGGMASTQSHPYSRVCQRTGLRFYNSAFIQAIYRSFDKPLPIPVNSLVDTVGDGFCGYYALLSHKLPIVRANTGSMPYQFMDRVLQPTHKISVPVDLLHQRIEHHLANYRYTEVDRADLISRNVACSDLLGMMAANEQLNVIVVNNRGVMISHNFHYGIFEECIFIFHAGAHFLIIQLDEAFIQEQYIGLALQSVSALNSVAEYEHPDDLPSSDIDAVIPINNCRNLIPDVPVDPPSQYQPHSMVYRRELPSQRLENVYYNYEPIPIVRSFIDAKKNLTYVSRHLIRQWKIDLPSTAVSAEYRDLDSVDRHVYHMDVRDIVLDADNPLMVFPLIENPQQARESRIQKIEQIDGQIEPIAVDVNVKHQAQLGDLRTGVDIFVKPILNNRPKRIATGVKFIDRLFGNKDLDAQIIEANVEQQLQQMMVNHNALPKMQVLPDLPVPTMVKDGEGNMVEHLVPHRRKLGEIGSETLVVNHARADPHDQSTKMLKSFMIHRYATHAELIRDFPICKPYDMVDIEILYQILPLMIGKQRHVSMVHWLRKQITTIFAQTDNRAYDHYQLYSITLHTIMCCYLMGDYEDNLLQVISHDRSAMKRMTRINKAYSNGISTPHAWWHKFIGRKTYVLPSKIKDE